jgi:hypothetical protein
VNRNDFQALAETRLADAQALLGGGQWSGAYYLAGYAVECALKASIARGTNQHDFPDKGRTIASYQHNLDNLIGVAGLRTALQAEISNDNTFAGFWGVVTQWNEETRYTHWEQQQAAELVNAVADPNHGVLRWLRTLW